MLIVGLNKTTLLDYPGRVAAAVFVGGCNFKCPFCHNAGIVLDPLSQASYSEAEILSFLEKRKSVLKGVCITGGEPTLHADLPDFLRKIKNLGYQIKLDTNGYAPKVLEGLLEENLLDYMAMDLKNCPEKYAVTVGMDPRESDPKEFDMDKINESVALLKGSGIAYEFRTTLVKELHDKEDMQKIAEWVKGCPRYFLQQYQKQEAMTTFTNEDFQCYTKEEMEELAEAMRRISETTVYGLRLA